MELLFGFFVVLPVVFLILNINTHRWEKEEQDRGEIIRRLNALEASIYEIRKDERK